jgi:3-oxoacyl-[acyl-carrier protein] reductase
VTEDDVTADEPRVAVVSGGSRGIGRAVVQRLASDGFDVAFCYRSRADEAKQLQELAAESGARVVATQVDVTDAAAVRRWCDETEDSLGPIEAVVTSAGIVRDNPLLLMADEDWSDVLRVNLDGVYNVCRSVIFGMMKRKRGCVVNISSAAGVYGNPTQSNYSASKAGIIGFTRSLAKEVGRYGIRVNAVAPGFIETDMTAELTEQVRKRMLGMIALNRFGTVEEVADLVGYLAQPRAAYITGAVLQIDGGVTI